MYNCIGRNRSISNIFSYPDTLEIKYEDNMNYFETVVFLDGRIPYHTHVGCNGVEFFGKVIPLSINNKVLAPLKRRSGRNIASISSKSRGVRAR